MRFFAITVAAFAAAVAALEINTFPAEGVVAGQTYTITYSPADDTPTTFILRQGKSTDLTTVGTLTTTATGGKFEWTPEKSLPSQPDYALQIQRGSVINYSAQFPLKGGSDAPVSSPKPSGSASSSPTPSPANSMSSAMASMMSSMTNAMPSASATMGSGANSTVSSPTLSKTHLPTGTSSGTLPQVTTAGGNNLAASPFAAMFGALAAFAYLA
ncbi:GPI-anchored domain containing protein [Pyrenophora tritici-repentis]|uniref:GPI-anchored multi-domain protein n=2 Tax=Pyrenophora tritici-repentis TaxID=45151 RepID=A0A2W1CJS5_9PLEO|nr:uncharacterized protein PTRG_08089 [Pyrenophora tritici-repentis Pt-1C-BFP]KAA8616558.1 GPI-anchored multi-domain protein [Pyrenophora tritici-repentis]EDU51008.1 conserved hypothetical protein [Pyrenophora tritici-repentis Pt-1C-BFP]KAF7445813.1 GPI-anchored multi-domain protein [Pyrenophora tritici-repentis]KAF7566940.1 GPI-anchored multi-domain protein [Pyrenophora tritici-repentis]KAG9381529.1 GPI-anchored multi-domain protein [Pyrenophora tritici-repentis]